MEQKLTEVMTVPLAETSQQSIGLKATAQNLGIIEFLGPECSCRRTGAFLRHPETG